MARRPVGPDPSRAERLCAEVLADRPLPEPADLGVEDAAYLNAMAEAASELRRQVLDRLRENDLARAEFG